MRLISRDFNIFRGAVAHPRKPSAQRCALFSIYGLKVDGERQYLFFKDWSSTKSITSILHWTPGILTCRYQARVRISQKIFWPRIFDKIYMSCALAVTGLAPVRADASLHDAVRGLIVTSLAPAPAGGFWIQYDNPELFEDDPFDARTIPSRGAPDLGSVSWRGSIAAVPGRNAYYILTPQGRIYARGDTPQKVDPVVGWSHLSHHSSSPRVPIASQFIVAAAAHPSGQGLWAVGRDGSVWTWGTSMEVYGDVKFDSAEPPAIVPTPTGQGYYIAMDDGGVHARGDAHFYGSKPNTNGHDVTGMALSIGHDGRVNGYYLVASDGGIHTFGSAPFWGSTGGNNGGFPVTNMVSFSEPVWNQVPQRTRGYAWVNTHGVVTAVYGTHWQPYGSR
jgi:hypothetical protein